MVILPEPISAAFKSVAQFGLKKYLAQREQVAHEELVAEMRKGRPWAIADDRTAAMALQYVRAAREGAARLNLRLMAQFMFAEAAQATMTSTVHRRNGEHLASLSLEEMIICAKLVIIERDFPPLSPDASREEVTQDTTDRARRFSKDIAPLFGSHGDAEGYGNSLLRTGWLRTIGDWSGSGSFATTKAFLAVADMVEFEAVAAEAIKHGVE